jgi:hypothetical protein
MESFAWTTKLLALDKRIKGFSRGYRQNIALLGNDSQETSYLLENYLQFNRSCEITYIHTSTAYLDKKEFFRSVAFSLLSDYTRKQDSLDNLINLAGAALNSTADFIKDCLEKKNLTFLDALEVINKFINESNRRCILIIEEFLGLEELFKNFYQDFSKFIILQRNCMLVLTSSRSKAAQKILSSELNLLFSNFERVSLNENSFLNNFIYLKNKLYPISTSPFFLSFFINVIGTNITYYDLIAPVLKRAYRPDNEEGAMIDTMEEIFYSKETYFFQKFIREIELIKFNCKDFSNILKLLFALSDGYLRKNELTSLGIYASKELGGRLQKLTDLNCIENLGNIYKIKDSLFAFWLKSVFKLYTSPPTFDPGQRKSLCRKKIEEEVLLFKEEFFKDKLKKVLQLFSSFKNDTLWVGKDKYRLPAVEKTKIISYPQRDFHLLVGEGKEIIFAGIKEGNTQENDIFEFIEKGTNIKGKRVRKIFISLDDLPPTARLIAKNNKLIVWDVNDVNRLLGIYNKSLVACDTDSK